MIHGDNLKKFALNPLCLMSHNEIYEITKPNKNISLSKAHEMLQYMKTLELVQPHCWFQYIYDFSGISYQNSKYLDLLRALTQNEYLYQTCLV